MSIEKDTGQWSFETDVVVVGSGGCGLTAAMAAAQGGVEVVVFEKQPRPWSNTARSGGMIPAADTRFQKAAGIQETAEDFAADIFRKNQHASDREMTLHLARAATGMVEWLVDDVGVNLVFIDDFKYPGHSEYRMHAPPNRTGGALVQDLRRAVEKHPQAELITDAAVTGLVADETGAGRGGRGAVWRTPGTGPLPKADTGLQWLCRKSRDWWPDIARRWPPPSILAAKATRARVFCGAWRWEQTWPLWMPSRRTRRWPRRTPF